MLAFWMCLPPTCLSMLCRRGTMLSVKVSNLCSAILCTIGSCAVPSLLYLFVQFWVTGCSPNRCLQSRLLSTPQAFRKWPEWPKLPQEVASALSLFVDSSVQFVVQVSTFNKYASRHKYMFEYKREYQTNHSVPVTYQNNTGDVQREDPSRRDLFLFLKASFDRKG